jgi:hypothetical protein
MLGLFVVVCNFNCMRSALLHAFYEFLTQQFKCRRGIFIFMAAGALTQLPIQLFLSSAGAKLQLEFVCIARMYMKIYFGAIEFVA